MSDEKMVTDPTTGGMKGSKAERYDLIPAGPLRELALHYGRNSVEHGGKYPARNWEKGYKWSLSFSSLMRHAWAMWRGEWLDPDSPGGQTPHLVAVAWHAFAMLEWKTTHPELDDRPRPPKEPSLREQLERAYGDLQYVPPVALSDLAPPAAQYDIRGARPRCDCAICTPRPPAERCYAGCSACATMAARGQQR